MSNVLNGVGKRREARAQGVPFRQKRCQPKRTKCLINKVSNAITKPNVPSQRGFVKLNTVSQTTIWRVIHDNLKMITRKKEELIN